MSGRTEFHNRLAELNLTYTQIELVKQTVEEFVIGSDDTTATSSGHRGPHVGPYAGLHRNVLRGEQRKALRG